METLKTRFAGYAKQSDLWLILGLFATVIMLVMPVPTFLLDLALAFSIAMSLLILLIISLWYGFPIMMLAASAGLKLIPAEVSDAAAMDGASNWQSFRYIYWPLLFPLLIPAIIIRGIFAFNQFYLFQISHMFGNYSLTTLATLSYNLFNPSSGGFGRSAGQFAISAGLNILTMIILMVFVALFNRWSKAGAGVTYA